MQSYLFCGVILPERAQLSQQFELKFSHIASSTVGKARVSILLNQVAVWIETENEWDVFDLRNVVRSLIQNHLSMVGYLKGYAYDLEITRVLNRAHNVDYVFGIDIPCLAGRVSDDDLPIALEKLQKKVIGEDGIFITRCLSDLISAMKHADDTGFYCYRALESLRHHCAIRYGMAGEKDASQWEKFREIAQAGFDTLMEIKAAADPLRHGKLLAVSSDERAKLLSTTWTIVDSYLGSF
jgi:hypothetical protein